MTSRLPRQPLTNKNSKQQSIEPYNSKGACMDLLCPMLSSQPAESVAIKKMTADGWMAQQKLDGVRLLIHTDEGSVIPVNRSGAVIDLPSTLVEPFSAFSTGQFAFDGEFVGGVFWLFDLPVAGSAVAPSMPYEHRLAVLEQFYQRWGPGESVMLVPLAPWMNAKLCSICFVAGTLKG
jgi:ATP-dependent DNA ligase